MSGINLKRHLLIATGLLVVAIGVVVLRYWDTFEVMLENLRAMREGQALAETLRSPQDLLDYLLAHPEQASLVVFDITAPDSGLYFQSEVARPVAGLPRLLLLAGYAEAVGQSRLDPNEPIARWTLDRYVLPSLGAQVHMHALSLLPDTGDSLFLRQVVQLLLEGNDPAAHDYLLLRLGQTALATLSERLKVPSLEPPLPLLGLFLSWHTMPALANRSTDPFALTEAVVRDAHLYDALATHLEQQGSGLSLWDQRDQAQATYPRGTAQGYALLLQRIAADSSVWGHDMRRYLERTLPDTLQTSLKVLAVESGLFPGLVSVAAYARRHDQSGVRVAVLLMESVPMALLYHLAQTRLEQGLVLQLLGDDAFFEQARRQWRTLTALAQATGIVR